MEQLCEKSRHDKTSFVVKFWERFREYFVLIVWNELQFDLTVNVEKCVTSVIALVFVTEIDIF